MSPISKTDGDKARDGKFNSHDRMKNLGEMGRGRVWRRPVKIKDIGPKNRLVNVLREIEFVVNNKY